MTPEFDADRDLIPDAGLMKILELVDRLPAGFDVTSQQGHQSSCTVTIAAMGVRGPFGQVEAVDAILHASTVTGTLARNLRHERAENAKLRRRLTEQEEQ